LATSIAEREDAVHAAHPVSLGGVWAKARLEASGAGPDLSCPVIRGQADDAAPDPRLR